MRISILILTHNRPKLFKRCLSSVLKNKPSDVEILVNNDSKDVKEVKNVKFFYECNNDITKTYKFLFDKAKGEFIYFLEDDDYVVDEFYDILKDTHENTIFRYIPFSGIKNYLNFWKGDFEYNFQIGQMFFRRKDLKNFPTKENYLQNDLEIYKRINKVNAFKHTKKNIYYQTTDGNDNISFYYLNKDKRFKIDEKYR